MIIPKDLINEAKQKMGEKAALIIAKDLNLEQFNERDLKALCHWHQEDTPSLIWNPKNNSYKCFGCGKNYDIINHYMSYEGKTYIEAVQKLFEQTGIKYSFGEKGVKTRDYRYPQYTPDDNRDKAEEYLGLRKISPKTLDYFDIEQLDGNIVFNFYDENDVLTTVKLRPARKVKHGESKMWFLPNADYKPILFGMHKIDPTKPLLITEGEIDALSVFEAGYSNVVSIPGGTDNKKWIDECWNWLEQFDTIILWFDNDLPGVKARKDVASRLGTWRTLIVDVPQTIEKEDGTPVPVKDANEILYHFGSGKVMQFIENAQEIPVVGVSNLANVGDFNIKDADGLYTHLKPIDDIVYKFIMGSVVVVTGKAGSGKSSLINQIFINETVNQGYDVFCYSGELDAKVLKSWIDLNLAGEENIIPSSDKAIRVIKSEAKEEINKWYDGRVWVYDNVSNKAKDIIETGINVTRKYGAKVWVIDNLMMLDLENDDKEGSILQKQKEFMADLVRIAHTYNILIVLVIHPRKVSVNQSDLIVDDVSGSGNLVNLSQYVLSVKRISDKEKQGVEDKIHGGYKKGFEPIPYDVSVEILKNRYTGKLGLAPLNFEYSSYRFYSNDNERYKRYKWNKSTVPVKQLAKSLKQEDTGDNFFIG